MSYGVDRSWFATLIKIMSFLLYSAAFTSLPFLGFLAFYIGLGDWFTGNTSNAPSMWDATKIIIQQPVRFIFSPETLSPRDKSVLFSYGNALILFISLFAVILSSFSVFSKLAEISAIVPFDSYIPRRVRYFDWLRFLGGYVKTSNWYYSTRIKMVKKFASKLMLKHYQNADSIIIISGDYSWLFDNKWSIQLREIVSAKIDGRIKLMSHKTADEVITEWKKYPDYKSAKEIFDNIVFHCDVKGHQASLIEKSTSSSYIHLYRDVRRSKINESVCIFYSDREAGDLIRLAKNQFLSEYKRQKQVADARKDEILRSDFSANMP